jgi:hypothetical protein
MAFAVRCQCFAWRMILQVVIFLWSWNSNGTIKTRYGTGPKNYKNRFNTTPRRLSCVPAPPGIPE